MILRRIMSQDIINAIQQAKAVLFDFDGVLTLAPVMPKLGKPKTRDLVVNWQLRQIRR